MNKNNHFGKEGVHNYKLKNCVAYVYIVQQSLNEYLFVHSTYSCTGLLHCTPLRTTRSEITEESSNHQICYSKQNQLLLPSRYEIENKHTSMETNKGFT